jgi:hypothetical protein
MCTEVCATRTLDTTEIVAGSVTRSVSAMVLSLFVFAAVDIDIDIGIAIDECKASAGDERHCHG